MELETELESAQRESEKQRAERRREHDVHLAEVSALKQEISEKIPQIAENAADTAGRRWRQQAESEIAAVAADKNRRIRESQVGHSGCPRKFRKRIGGFLFSRVGAFISGET